MLEKVTKKWIAVIATLIIIIILGITSAIPMNDDSETEIIGQNDGPTNI